MNEVSCTSSDLYSVEFVGCSFDAHFTGSRLRKVRFVASGSSFDFERCDLEQVEYIPPTIAVNYLGVSEIYRQLRTAYQSIGKRHDATQCYYNERKYERKAWLYPYLAYSDLFPRRKHGNRLGDLIKQWREGKLSSSVARQRVGSLVSFHIRVWCLPQYCFTAARFRLRYVVALLEEVVWGYGEKPWRIILLALCILAVYTAVYCRLLNFGANPRPTSLVDCAYLSVATFTTLGFGDIPLRTDEMKIACGSEAALGDIRDRPLRGRFLKQEPLLDPVGPSVLERCFARVYEGRQL